MSKSKGRDILHGLTSGELKSAGGPSAPQGHRAPGAIRAMNLSLGKLNEEAAAAKALREAIASGDNVVSLDADLVDRSFAEDRINEGSAIAYTELKESIQRSGQQVPILVRPHPLTEGRYQIAYGHRRHQVAKDLSRAVIAVVKPLTDRELLLAQGQENGLRADLTFIERARFGRKLEESGYDRDFIALALGVDKPETSRLLQVSASLPDDLIVAIGSAPKIGRPRWLAMAEKLKDKGALRRAMSELALPEVRSFDSSRRFEYVWKLLAEQTKIQDPVFIRSPTGSVFGSIVRSKSGVKITFRNQDFADYVLEKIDQFASEFTDKKRRKSDD